MSSGTGMGLMGAMNGGNMPISGGGGRGGVASSISRGLSRNGSRGLNLRYCLCLANTHQYSNPRNPDVKLRQTLTSISELEQLIQSRDIDFPLLICGDFDSEPGSAVYRKVR